MLSQNFDATFLKVGLHAFYPYPENVAPFILAFKILKDVLQKLKIRLTYFAFISYNVVAGRNHLNVIANIKLKVSIRSKAKKLLVKEERCNNLKGRGNRGTPSNEVNKIAGRFESFTELYLEEKIVQMFDKGGDGQK